MSASYFLLKMFKRNHNKRRQNLKFVTKAQKCIKQNNKITINNRCRICLNEGAIPIYGTELTCDLPNAIRSFGGVEITENDTFPQHLCEGCHALLKGAILFRKSAKKSDEILRQASTYDTDVLSDDDFKNHLDASKEQEIYKPTMKKVIKHGNVRIQCRICMKVLTKHLYERHLARHQSASHLVCEVCGKLYRKDNLLRHSQLHSNELPFKCTICPYRGRFMESLKIHMRTHSGDKPFSCDKCQLRFITRSNLNRHLLTHEKEKPFKCIECNRGFYTQRDIDIHLRADHAGIKEFSCTICANKYGTKKALMRHELKVHKRDKMAKGRVPLYLQPEFQSYNKTMIPAD